MLEDSAYFMFFNIIARASSPRGREQIAGTTKSFVSFMETSTVCNLAKRTNTLVGLFVEWNSTTMMSEDFSKKGVAEHGTFQLPVAGNIHFYEWCHWCRDFLLGISTAMLFDEM